MKSLDRYQIPHHRFHWLVCQGGAEDWGLDVGYCCFDVLCLLSTAHLWGDYDVICRDLRIVHNVICGVEVFVDSQFKVLTGLPMMDVVLAIVVGGGGSGEAPWGEGEMGVGGIE